MVSAFKLGQDAKLKGAAIGGQSDFPSAVKQHGPSIACNKRFSTALMQNRHGEARIALETESPFSTLTVTAFSDEPLGEHLKNGVLWIPSSGGGEHALFGGISERRLKAFGINLDVPGTLLIASGNIKVHDNGNCSYTAEVQDGTGLSALPNFKPFSGWRMLSSWNDLPTGKKAEGFEQHRGYLHVVNKVGVVTREVSERDDWATVKIGDLFGTPRSVLLVEGRMG